MPEFVDISVALIPGRVPLYPNDTPLDVARVQERATGGKANVSKLVCSLHCGTHVDGRSHFFDAQPGVADQPLGALIGPSYVVDARAVTGHLGAADLERLDIPSDAERLLFRTRNSEIWNDPHFTEDFIAIAPDAARALVERGARLVGIDFLSIAPYDEPAPTHEILLDAGVTIVETLDLRAAEPGWWQLICLPLRIPGGDGGPARAVLSRAAGG